MPKACSWSSPPEEISPHLWAKFSTLYDAPSDIDLFSAGLAETLLPGAHVGPTFACIIGRQVGQYYKILEIIHLDYVIQGNKLSCFCPSLRP